MTVVLDLNLRHWTHHRRGLTAIGTWIRLDGRVRPCLALVRRGEEARAETVPCVLTLDRAWIWSEDVGDPAAAARMAVEFAEALRLGGGRDAVFLIAGLVHDLLGDLVTMPPFPPAELPRTVIAEVTVTERASGRSHEVELGDV